MLAGPWPGSNHNKLFRVALPCCDVHPYSRVLDDAIDENNPCQLAALLSAKEWLWRAPQKIAILRPQLCSASLIADVTLAAASNEPDAWRRKNHHLLLLPLYLGGRRMFRRARAALSATLSLLQAEEEFAQGAAAGISDYCAIIDAAAQAAPELGKLGWGALAGRVLSGCHALLAQLEENERTI